jgi:ornithine--oxo-acid transaminase
MHDVLDEAAVDPWLKVAAARKVAKLLMCAPTLYQVNYVINPWMEGNLGHASHSRAMAQWEALHAALCEIADVELVDPVAGSPDMVFTANAGLMRHGRAVVSRFRHAERQGEEAHFARWFSDAGYQVVEMPGEISFEGEGDALFSRDGGRLWAGYGPRTCLASHAALRPVWDVEVVSLRLIDPRFYHLDTCFAPLADGSLLYYPKAFDAAGLVAIEEHYAPAQRIAVSEEDALRFACNAVNLGPEIVLNRISLELEQQLRDRGFEVTQIELDEFLKAGGAAKCLVMHLDEESD